MPTFAYKAKKSSAETVSGEISAQTKDEAIDLITQLGFLPVTVEAQTIQLAKPRKIKSKELYLFSRQLANLLKSGVPLLRALKIIGEQTRDLYFRQIIVLMADQVKNGCSFSEALNGHPQIFSPLYVTMVHAGEESGNLYEVLTSLSSYQQRQEEIRSKVQTALAYPCFMGAVGGLTVLFILIFVLPRMANLFSSLGSQLPLPTVILLSVSKMLSKGWIVLILIAVGIVLGFRRFRRSVRGQILMSQMLLHAPLFGELILKSELSRFTRTLAMLLKSGVSIVRGLQIAIPVVENDLLKSQLMRCKDSLIAGRTLTEGLRQATDMPSMMIHLLGVGEESGNLIEVLQEITDTYEQESNEKIRMLTTLIEPTMILGVGLIIGFMVFAMLLPIFQIDVLAK